MKIRNLIKEIQDNNKGVSLVELLVSIALLALIIGAFLVAFEYTTKNNIRSGKKVGEGYIAQTCMEEIIHLSNSKDMTELIEAMKEDGYSYSQSEEGGRKHMLTKVIDGYYVKIAITEDAFDLSSDLLKVVIGIYEDSFYSNLVASIQNIIKT